MATTEHSDLEQQIIKTAQQLFIEKGFVETSMSDIAATVGINRPTLHYYFRTKDKMFKAGFGSIVMSLMPKIKDIVKQETFGTPGLFENRSEHENGKHIKKYMAEPAMHKHVRDELCRIEITCEEKM